MVWLLGKFCLQLKSNGTDNPSYYNFFMVQKTTFVVAIVIMIMIMIMIMLIITIIIVSNCVLIFSITPVLSR